MINFDPPATHRIPEDRYEPKTVDECCAVDRVMVGLGNILVATIRDGAMKEARYLSALLRGKRHG